MKAGLHRNTATAYLASGQLPGSPRGERSYRTRPDPFGADWADVEALLAQTPELEAKTVMEDLIAKHPERYGWGHLRTLQRRLRRWRAQYGPEREVFFAQEHRPGEAGQIDFTWATELGITIRREPYAHMLSHLVLPCSNWGWAVPCRSESMAALSEGLQDGLWELGGVPQYIQTDNSTAATHDLRSGKRAFNAQYLALVAYYGATPRTTGIGKKEQNGDVEALNGALKRDLHQQLLLRGSRDFSSPTEYRMWLAERLRHRNATRGEKVGMERALLLPLPPSRVPSWREMDVRVGQGSTIRVMGHAYSVPTRLIGERVRVRVHESRVEVVYAGEVEMEVERGRGKGGFRIEYRHVIGSLVRKPGAFRDYRYREALFPTQVFRQAYERMGQELSAWATDVEYLQIVLLAAQTVEADVEGVLAEMLSAGRLPRAEAVRERLKPVRSPVPVLSVPEVDLTSYDELYEANAEREAS